MVKGDARARVVVAALLTMVLTACARGTGSSVPTPAPSSSASPTVEPVAEIVSTVPVGGEPIGIAEGEGAL
jgi:hypothetical protein